MPLTGSQRNAVIVTERTLGSPRKVLAELMLSSVSKGKAWWLMRFHQQWDLGVRYNEMGERQGCVYWKRDYNDGK